MCPLPQPGQGAQWAPGNPSYKLHNTGRWHLLPRLGVYFRNELAALLSACLNKGK